jgi:hypothetical protein
VLLAINDGVMSYAHPGARGYCPACAQEVAPKCGSKVVWHWAHRSLKDCDSWSEGETAWHAAWKSRFAQEQTEVSMDRGGVRHRADVVADCGTTIEFQHSSISCEEIAGRELFYGKMIWVVDCTKCFLEMRLGLNFHNTTDVAFASGRRPLLDAEGRFVKFRWKSRRRSFDDCGKAVFLDLGFAFSDHQDAFYRKSEWFDEGNGVRRPANRFWRRTSHELFLLEVKKQHESGYGWGRLISHKAFCRRFGAVGFIGYPATQSVRQCPEEWEYRDGYAYCGEFGMNEFPHLCGYRWCEQQIEHLSGIKEAV